MAAIDQILSVSISQQTQAVAQASFKSPLIVGPTSAGFTGGRVVNAYTSPAAMLAAGYTTSSPEYIYAQLMFSGPNPPALFYAGLRTTPVAQVSTLSVNSAVSGTTYTFTFNGVLISFLSADTIQQNILTGLLNAYNTAFPLSPPATGAVTGVGTGALLTFTATVPGAGFSITSVFNKLTLLNPTANNGIATDLALIQSQNDLWYGMVGCAFTDNDILQAAAYIESQLKIYIPVSSTAAIATSATTDVGSVLQQKAYKRSGLIFTALPAEGKDAGWMSGQLFFTPGSNNWAFANIPGATPDVLTPNQQAILIGVPVNQVSGKNVNIYQTVGGVNIMQMGTMAGGQFIDVTVGVDWLKSQIQTNIFGDLVNSPKIPYTDKGTGKLLSDVKAAIDQGVTNGLIDGDSPITVTAPLVSTVPPNQRANRVAPTISFSCRLAGAYNAIVVQGTVTV